MFQLLETIKIVDGVIQNLEYHNYRFNKTRKDLFGQNEFIDIKNLIKNHYNNSLLKCRLIYSKNSFEIDINPYEKKIIKSLKLVHDDKIEYSYKFADRSSLNNLLKLKEECDEILIIKKGHVTDTSFSNIVFYDGNKWLTPDQPLLFGTKRSMLLREGIIQETRIKECDILNFEKASLINAMLEINDVVINANMIK